MQESKSQPPHGNTEDSVNQLAAAIIEVMPNLDDDERRLAVAIYRGLAEGHSVALAQAATNAGLDLVVARRTVDEWSGVFFDENGGINGFWGLALEKMPHRLEIDGREITTWCAWDPLFIVPLLGTRARVRSNDPLSGEEISLAVSRTGVEEIDPPEAVVSFRAPTEPWDESIVQSFCHYVLYFASKESGQRWVSDHPGTFLLSVKAAFEVGRRVTHQVFGMDED